MPPRKKTKANSGKPVAIPDKQSEPAAALKHKPTAQGKASPPASTKPSRKPPAKKAQKPRATKQATRKRAPVAPIYDELWKEVYLAGTEWDQIKDVYKIDWDFDHLDDQLTEGDLAGKKVHLFGCTEPQLIMMDDKDTKGSVVPVPAIVAVVSDSAPPATVGLKSVQRAEEDILPMSKLRMGWHAHTPSNVRSRRFVPMVHVLKCNERRARLRNMEEAAVHQYDYVLPYFIRPGQEEDVTIDTVVQVLADLEGIKAPLVFDYDFELDELDEFVEETLTENELEADKHSEAIKKAIRETVKATKLKYKAERDERKRRIDEISQEDRDAIKNMKLIKFYPANDWPNISSVKSKYINRYYGQANEIL